MTKKKEYFVNVETSPDKSNFPQKVSSPVLTATSEGKIFLSKHIPTSNVPTEIVNNGKDAQNSFAIKASNGSNRQFQWKIKVNVSLNESRKVILPKPSRKTIILKKHESILLKVEYDLWIKERTLTFYIFPKES